MQVEVSYGIYHWVGTTDDYTIKCNVLHLPRLDDVINVFDPVTEETTVFERRGGRWYQQTSGREIRIATVD